jgi:hypothetical protein
MNDVARAGNEGRRINHRSRRHRGHVAIVHTRDNRSATAVASGTATVGVASGTATVGATNVAASGATVVAARLAGRLAAAMASKDPVQQADVAAATGVARRLASGVTTALRRASRLAHVHTTLRCAVSGLMSAVRRANVTTALRRANIALRGTARVAMSTEQRAMATGLARSVTTTLRRASRRADVATALGRAHGAAAVANSTAWSYVATGVATAGRLGTARWGCIATASIAAAVNSEHPVEQVETEALRTEA